MGYWDTRPQLVVSPCSHAALHGLSDDGGRNNVLNESIRVYEKQQYMYLFRVWPYTCLSAVSGATYVHVRCDIYHVLSTQSHCCYMLW